MEFRRHDLLGMPRRVLRWQKVELIFWLRKDFTDEPPEPPIEFATRRAAGLGKHEAPLVDVATQAATRIRSEVERITTRQPKHRRLQQVVERGGRRVEDVPRQPGGLIAAPA